MADVNVSGYVTLLDLAQETKDKQFIDVAKILTEKVPVIQDAAWVEANDLNSHVFGRDAALASGGFRAFNNGVDATAGQTDQLTEPIGLYEDRGIVDVELAKRAPSPMEFRYRKDNQHLRGGVKYLGTKIAYGNRVTDGPNGVDGLITRLSALAAPTATTSGVFNNGDATAASVASALFVQWGEDKVHMLYPKNSKTAGIERNDLGKQLVTGANSKQFVAWVTQFIFNYGIAIFNPRCIARVANIGTQATKANPFDIDLGIEAMANMEDGGEGAILYVPRKVLVQLEVEAKNHGSDIVRWVETSGNGRVLYFKNAPVKLWESMTLTEAVVA